MNLSQIKAIQAIGDKLTAEEIAEAFSATEDKLEVSEQAEEPEKVEVEPVIEQTQEKAEDAWKSINNGVVFEPDPEKMLVDEDHRSIFVPPINSKSDQLKPYEIKEDRQGKPWTAGENNMLEELVKEDFDFEYIAEKMKRSCNAIRTQASLLGFMGLKQKQTTWIKAEEDSLISLSNKGLSCSEIAEEMGRTYDSISNKARSLGLKLTGKKNKRWWSDDELLEIKNMLKRYGTPQAAFNNQKWADNFSKRSGRSLSAIKQRLEIVYKEKPTSGN